MRRRPDAGSFHGRGGGNIYVVKHDQYAKGEVMKIKMKMPDLAVTETDIEIIRWLVEPGQPVKRGQALVEIQTDKAAMEVESIGTGILIEVCAVPKEHVEVGKVIAVIETQDENQSSGNSGIK